jgi:hypothetical protein
VFSDVRSRKSYAPSIRSRAVEPLPVKDLPVEDKMTRVAASIKEQEKQEAAAENGTMYPVIAQPENVVQD